MAIEMVNSTNERETFDFSIEDYLAPIRKDFESKIGKLD
jgi:hypothetical protein